MTRLDKAGRAALFRDRVERAMRRIGLSRSELAREAGVDRSTIGQILAADAVRLPNAHLAAETAAALRVSADWLLGLTDRPERPGDLIAGAMEVAAAERSAADEQIISWHREASGYKIRHVPATLPEILKTEALLRWEHEGALGRTPDEAIAEMRRKLDWLRTAPSDYEVAMPIRELTSLAEGSGFYEGLDIALRREQLAELARLADELYPRLRLFLFDARRVFSAPITVFGPLLAVVYVGRFYLAFRERERVAALTGQFDWLVREASVDAREMPGWIAGGEARDRG